ncbi:hypothetical protein Ahy_B07g087909 [Arachis hypogaea]|uniref:MULE transposase domain-containing protein n=1 Tax=Arachis hypogaea TaxID=3818 RepID=A0A444YDA7_ARAHY|nr:hypothetical protein Ahy_B07g087909 [Arachis hypogaea]
MHQIIKALDNYLDRSRGLCILGGNANASISYIDVIAFDATYKKNKYKKSLVIFSGSNYYRQMCIFGVIILDNEMTSTYNWLLAKFLEVMMNKHSKVVVTDADEPCGLDSYPQFSDRIRINTADMRIGSNS